MGHTVPSRDLTLPERANYRKQVIESGLRRMKAMANLTDTQVGWRDLAPSDVGLTSWATPTITVGGDWYRWIDTVVATLTVLGIYKVTQLSSEPAVSTIRFSIGGAMVGINELESCYAGYTMFSKLNKESREVLDRLAGRDDNSSKVWWYIYMEAYFCEPLEVPMNNRFRVDVMSRQPSDGDYLVLGGFTIEPRGLTIV